MSPNIYWLLEVAVKQGKIEEFKNVMNTMVSGTNENEPGTLNYEWNLSSDNTMCHIYERYADSEAVMQHLGNFGNKYAESFLAVVEPKRLSVYGSPSNEVRGALRDFGAVYFTPVGGFVRQW